MKFFDLTSWFVTRGQKEGGPWNWDRWMSQQRTHKFEYVFCFWWTNQELKKYTVKVELLKPTTPKNCIFMPFLDTNSHLTTKPYNFDIKCQSNSESYDRHSFFWDQVQGGSEFVNNCRRFFQRERVLWGWLAGPCHMVDIIHYAKAWFLLLIPHTKIWFRNLNFNKDYEYVSRCHNWINIMRSFFSYNK